MSLSHEKRRRRKAIRSWIPAALLLVVIAVVLSVAVVTRMADVGAAPEAPPSDAVTAQGTSLFTSAGLEYIADTRRVFIDATELPIEADPLGLDDTGTLTVIPPTEGVYVYLSVVGTGGGMRFMGTSIDIVTADGLVQSASVSDSTRFLPYRDTQALLRERADRFGIPAADLEGFVAASAAALREGKGYSYSIHSDDALGVGLTVTADCSSDSICRIMDRVEFDRN